MTDMIEAGSNTHGMVEHDDEDLHKHSRFLRKIAWFVEIIVVMIGLSISISLVITGDNIAGAFTLSAPFVMVSLVELTKIPFVIGLWHAKKSFVMYLVIISFLCLITFETLLNGFERAFSSINSQINLSEIKITEIENKIKINEEKIENALRDYNVKTQNISSDKSNVYEDYKKQYASAVKRSQISSKNIPKLRSALNTARGQLNQLKVEKSELLQELSAKKEEKFQSSLARAQGGAEMVQQERTRLLEQLKTLNAEKKKAVDEANFFTSSIVKKEYDDKIRYVEEQVNNLNTRTITGKERKPDLESVKFLDDYYAELLSLKDDMIQQKNEEVQSLSRSYNQAVNASNKNLAARQSRLSKAKTTALKSLNNKLERVDAEFSDEKQYINELKDLNSKLRFDIRVIEIEANTMALSNQIYRMASYIDNVSHYKEVTKKTLTLVGIVWFGSLAFIGSITGIALTLSGLHLKSLAAKQRQKEKEIADTKSNADADANRLIIGEAQAR